MKLIPLDYEIQLEVDEPKAGALDLSGTPRAIEEATVIAIGDKVTVGVKKGDRVMYKAWALDTCTKDGKKYHFISQTSNAIKAIIK